MVKLFLLSGQTLQIMDLETFEVFETSSVEDDIKNKIDKAVK